MSDEEEDKVFEIYVQEVIKECQMIFTSEEGNGKYLDLNLHYAMFRNVKQLTKLKMDLPQEYLTWL